MYLVFEKVIRCFAAIGELVNNKGLFADSGG
jgi:hypothetical protein